MYETLDSRSYMLAVQIVSFTGTISGFRSRIRGWKQVQR
jgi:hypothetical protein